MEDFKSEQCGGTSVRNPAATVSFPTVTFGNFRITEDNQQRLTEAGDLRLLE
jgi:hypothetical protein